MHLAAEHVVHVCVSGNSLSNRAACLRSRIHQQNHPQETPTTQHYFTGAKYCSVPVMGTLTSAQVTLFQASYQAF